MTTPLECSNRFSNVCMLTGQLNEWRQLNSNYSYKSCTFANKSALWRRRIWSFTDASVWLSNNLNSGLIGAKVNTCNLRYFFVKPELLYLILFIISMANKLCNYKCKSQWLMRRTSLFSMHNFACGKDVVSIHLAPPKKSIFHYREISHPIPSIHRLFASTVIRRREMRDNRIGSSTHMQQLWRRLSNIFWTSTSPSDIHHKQRNGRNVSFVSDSLSSDYHS